MKFFRSQALFIAIFSSSVVLGASHAYAQDVVIDVKTTVGTSLPQSGQYTVAAGSEVALHTGSVYRVVAVPTVLPTGQVRFDMKVFRVNSASNTPVSTPILVVGLGHEATIAQGTEPPSAENLKLQVTPRLK